MFGNNTKENSFVKANIDHNQAKYNRSETKQTLYEMDSFPKRSITNRLKNQQILQQNKKKMKVLSDKISQQNSLLPSITNKDGVKIVEVQSNFNDPSSQFVSQLVHGSTIASRQNYVNATTNSNIVKTKTSQ